MKQRVSTLDVRELARELQNVVGYRLKNVYELDTKTFLLYLNRADKRYVLIENGQRIHLTNYDRRGLAVANPSPFLGKLRKLLNGTRLVQIKQLGDDRALLLSFGYNEPLYHLVCEFFSTGNTVLTNDELEVVAGLRIGQGSEHSTTVGCKYDFDQFRTIPQLGENAVIEALRTHSEQSVKRALSTLPGIHSSVAEHWILSASSKFLNCRAREVLDDGIDRLLDLLPVIREIQQPCGSLLFGKGYIITREPRVEHHLSLESSDKKLDYVEYHPILFLQHQISEKYIEFDTFNEAMDHFYSTFELAKNEKVRTGRVETGERKLDRLKNDLDNRVESLETSAKKALEAAQCIEHNIDLVEQARLRIQLALASGLQWTGIETWLLQEKKVKSLMGTTIFQLQLETNRITLSLTHPCRPGRVNVDIDISSSAYTNAQHYYDFKRQCEQKKGRAIEMMEPTLAKARKKLESKSKTNSIPKTMAMAPVRKPLWFEKFSWFISSENYLVLAGRTAQQNELLVKRYLEKGDVYVHADIRGAASVVVKNGQKEMNGEWNGFRPIPHTTLEQAGSMSICCSNAWKTKIVTSAYWVHHHQVSKTAPSGEYLTTGSFVIRGKKHYLLPTELVYGFGFMFKLDADSSRRHLGERASSGSQHGYEAKMEQLIVSKHGDNDIDIVGEIDRKLNLGDQRSDRLGDQQETRAKKDKPKRLKAKYQDQDEEERLLKMELLGNKETVREVPSKVPDESEHKKRNECDQDIPDVDLSVLDTLTGIPRPDDRLLYAVPVCGPYSALSNYKYKIKLVPGMQKKGKACKLALESMLGRQRRNMKHLEESVKKELQLMMQVGENEMILAMLSGVNVVGLDKKTR